MNPPPTEGIASRLFLGPALRTQPDRRLVTLVRDGYESAFEEIVRRYGKALGRYAAAIVGSRSEDVTQDAFSKALLAMRRNPEQEIELRPWLYRIVRNTALNDLRNSPPDTTELVEALEGAGSSSAAEEFEKRQEVAELLDRLRALPEPQRAAIVMREMEGLGHDEIAAALGMSGGAARQAIYRARQALRDGVGLMVPLPILRALLEHGGEAGVAAGAGGAAIAAGGAGAGTALKVGVVTAVLAGSVGTGLAIKENTHRSADEASAATVRSAPGGDAGPGASSNSDDSSSGGGSDRSGSGDDGSGDNGRGGAGDGDHADSGRRGEPETSGDSGGGHGPTREAGDDHGGHGGGPGPGGSPGVAPSGSGRGGGPGPSDGGHGSDDSGSGHGTSGGGDGSSGSDDGGSGRSGSGGSGSGSGDSGSGDSGSGSGSGSGSPDDPLPPPPTGDDDSGSGSSSSGSSGSGSGDSGAGGGSGSGDSRTNDGSGGSGDLDASSILP